MSFEHLYEVWAPPESRWSPWVKPVLFAADASAGGVGDRREDFGRKYPWLPRSDLRTALVIDCPGDISLAIGVAAARAGFRPVPLFNACHGKNEVVSQQPLFDVIDYATKQLQETSLSPEAPPAFLLDSRRLKPERPPKPGDFDNRWMVFPQDFPSGNLLLGSGLENVLLVRPGATKPQDDLAHVLLRWQKAGISIRAVDSGSDGPPTEITIPKPPWYGWLWAGLLVGLGLRMHSAGGFGGIVPQPSSSSGRGYG